MVEKGTKASRRLGTVPPYVWTFLALLVGIFAGGWFPQTLTPLADITSTLIRLIVRLVPILILFALSPVIATLIKGGLAGRFGGSVILWYLISSAGAGLLGLTLSSLLFKIPFSAASSSAPLSESVSMISSLRDQTGMSLPLLSILGAIVLGMTAVRVPPLLKSLTAVEKAIHGLGSRLGYFLAPLILCLGVSLGVRFGASVGLSHYFLMSLYTLLLCFAWFLIYTVLILKGLGKVSLRKLLPRYYLPTAIFAAATCSSLATLPVNLTNVKRFGVRDEVADFVMPFGAVVNLDASALAYVAYGPFILAYVYNLEVSWTTLLAAWPAIVLFTIAAPGLPAGIGTALWSATLFVSMLGVAEPIRSNIIATWIALAGGLPDMIRTITNCTGDGFTAILFDKFFDRLFSSRRNAD